MSLYIPGTSWNYIASNTSATRPTTTGWGTASTSAAGPNFSAWTSVLTGKRFETFGINILFSNNSGAAALRNVLVDIGIDPAGGTNFVTVIPYLIASQAAPLSLGGISYYFPLYIPAGASIGVRAVGNAANAYTTKIEVYGQPSNPDIVQCGSKVFSFGQIVGTNSATGTSITPGQAAEGTATLMGTTTKSCWWWQCGLSMNNSNMAARSYTLDLLSGTSTANLKLILQDVFFMTTGSEQTYNIMTGGGNSVVPEGHNIYIRSQCSGIPDANVTAMAWGLA